MTKTTKVDVTSYCFVKVCDYFLSTALCEACVGKIGLEGRSAYLQSVLGVPQSPLIHFV